MEKLPLSPNAQKVQNVLDRLGVPLEVVELPISTRTAQEAAHAVGCQVGQIVKSLVFRGEHSGKPYLILVSGSNRADESRLRALLGEPIRKADAEFVRAQTGFAIGGVPPVGHPQHLDTWIDRDLLQYTEVWAAAGTPNAVFRLTPQELVRITQGKVVEVCAR